MVHRNGVTLPGVDMTCGVPQGRDFNVLTIYINDLPNVSKSLSSIQCAVYSQAYITGKSIADLIY